MPERAGGVNAFVFVHDAKSALFSARHLFCHGTSHAQSYRALYMVFRRRVALRSSTGKCPRGLFAAAQSDAWQVDPMLHACRVCELAAYVLLFVLAAVAECEAELCIALGDDRRFPLGCWNDYLDRIDAAVVCDRADRRCLLTERRSDGHEQYERQTAERRGDG